MSSLTQSRLLVLGDQEDPHIDALRRRRPKGSEVAVLDPAEQLRFPFWVRPGDDPSNLVSAEFQSVSVSPTVVMYRKPDLLALDREDLAAWQNEFSSEEMRAFMYTIFVALDHLPWINPPHVSARAGLRVLQLREAANIGLDVPAWSLTNSRRGLPSSEYFVVKRLSTRVVRLPQGMRIYTAPFDPLVDAQSEAFTSSASLISSRVAVRQEVRVVVVGSECLAFALPRSTESADYRTAETDHAWTTTSIPESVERLCVALTQRLDLQMSSIDLGFDGNRWWFFELNPNGEYEWLDRIADGNISDLVWRLVGSMAPMT